MSDVATTEKLNRGHPFRKRRVHSTLPRQYMARQARITHLAFALLGGRDPALAFLNFHHSGLGSKPIDLAGESEAGFSAVSSEIDRLKAGNCK